mmetsp:Transcript_30262/g.85345  ORF Transcript_30262/g.85345 Transcript_30262/m.85345 type:complete len:359 (-) Transcript_30262:68-1144(-)
MLTLSLRARPCALFGTRSSSHAVFRSSSRSIAHSAWSSTSGNWIAWFRARGSPKGARFSAYLTDSLTQYWAAPRLPAAWRIRFSCRKRRPLPRPWWRGPRWESLGTRTPVSDTRPWSLGMLKVHRYSSVTKPGASVGTMKFVMPVASPFAPCVRAKTIAYGAVCTPVIHIFEPLMTHSCVPSSSSARVSIQVASLPWSGSVSPKAACRPPGQRFFCSGVACSCHWRCEPKFPTTELSFWRSLCSPRPLEARCSRITAIQRFPLPLPPNSGERTRRRCPARSERRRISASSPSHSLLGRPPLSKSVRAHSRRWSKNRMLSSCICSGTISRSMNSSSSLRYATRSSGKSKFMSFAIAPGR